MKAIILSAGQGSRLGHLTDDRPKCLIEFGGKSLLDWQLDTLAANGYKIEWQEYPMPHSVCAEEVDAVGEWLAARFKSRILLT